MAKSFTEVEKQNIRHKLLEACATQWSKVGYKKTSVDELCAQAGISKGAFYHFFSSKESLFCETLCLVHDELYKIAEAILEKKPNKEGLADVLKAIYREYCTHSFICDIKSTDYITFTNKLTKEQLDAITAYSRKSGESFLDKPYIRFAMEREKGISAISALLSTISVKDDLCYDPAAVFDFMADTLVDKVFK